MTLSFPNGGLYHTHDSATEMAESDGLPPHLVSILKTAMRFETFDPNDLSLLPREDLEALKITLQDLIEDIEQRRLLKELRPLRNKLQSKLLELRALALLPALPFLDEHRANFYRPHMIMESVDVRSALQRMLIQIENELIRFNREVA